MRLSHKRNAIADRERHFVLAISDVNEKVGAGIIIEFEKAVACLVAGSLLQAPLCSGAAADSSRLWAPANREF
jgi:hypothetical protein